MPNVDAEDLVDVDSEGVFALIEIDNVATQSVAIDFGWSPPKILVHEDADSEEPSQTIRLPEADEEAE